jgi:hypothetical protein
MTIADRLQIVLANAVIRTPIDGFVTSREVGAPQDPLVAARSTSGFGCRTWRPRGSAPARPSRTSPAIRRDASAPVSNLPERDQTAPSRRRPSAASADGLTTPNRDRMRLMPVLVRCRTPPGPFFGNYENSSTSQ